MADLGAIASVASLVDLSGRILATGYSYISKVVNAPKELKRVLVEVTGIDSILDALLDQFPDAISTSATVPGLPTTLHKLAENGTLGECRKVLEEVTQVIKNCEQIEGQHVLNLSRRPLWPLHERETRNLIIYLNRVKSSLSTAVVIDSAVTLYRVDAGQAQMQKTVDAMLENTRLESRVHAHQQLSFWLTKDCVSAKADFEIALRPSHTKLFAEEPFQSWIEQGTSLLWVHGVPRIWQDNVV